MTKPNNRNEFRRQKDHQDGQNHPAYIYAQVGNKFKFLGITHSPITKGVKNIELEHNPDPNDSRKSYMRPPNIKECSKFGPKESGFSFTINDEKKAKELISGKKKKER